MSYSLRPPGWRPIFAQNSRSLTATMLHMPRRMSPRRRQPPERRGDVPADGAPGDERPRRPGHPGADPGLEVAPDALRDRRRAAFALAPLEVEIERPRALPQVRVVDPPLVAVDRVDEAPERRLPLRRGGLRRRMERRGPWVLAGDREVAEDEPQGQLCRLRPGRRAVRAREVEVEDRLRPLASNMILGPDRRDAGARQIGHAAQATRRPVEARLLRHADQ